MRQHFYNLIKYKDLFFELVRKDVSLKYRNSILGVFWSMLNPLLMMVVLSIVFMELFQVEIPNFPIYVLIGRILYQFFSESTNFAMDSIHINAQLIRKVYVPKYFFPLSRICSSFITTLIALIPLFIMMIATGMTFHWINLLFILPMIYLFFICSGIGLLLSSFNVFFKDVKHFYSVLLLIIMYMTPIFYPVSIIPDQYMILFLLNPLYPVVEIFRDVVMYKYMPDPTLHLLAVAYAIIYWITGLIVFYKCQDRFIYYL
ncbi:MAG: ABC transporter [Bacillus thermozeamaize]|uniref:Transport permease protein n=1 Tax=Bacillus thermozeamaize TaxID=230954 RepID=A0A1Y3PX98_9BACI|nr:MAG: ABC transporter [Bacillus thermozeamaize]